jgi:transcription antitermination factor NusG
MGPESWLASCPSDVTAWHAIWTRSNCEGQVTEQLATKGFRVFLPTASTWSRRSRRPRQIRVPLFPGYLFVGDTIDKHAYVEILKARGVVRILGDGWDRLARIPPGEIEAILRIVRLGQTLFPCRYLRAGDRVRIIGGPLSGVEGFFVRERLSKGLLVLSINLLQRSVAVEIDCTLVEAA